MYIIATYNNYRYTLYRGNPDREDLCDAMYISGMTHYTLASLLEFVSTQPTDSLLPTSILSYYIEHLPVVAAVDSWSE